MRRALCILTLLAASCIDEPCDPGEDYVIGLCVTAVPDARITDARDGDAAVEAVAAPFDSCCTASAQCGGVTNYCAILPGETEGFCTHDGCVEDPSVCPEGTTCIDLTPYGAAGLSICLGAGAC